ncbi:MAG: PIN domain-containing protein [Nanoarchaeota archaeon]
MTDSKLVDSSVWIEHLFNNKYNEIIDSDDILLISPLSLFEIKKKLKKEKIDNQKIKISLDYIKRKCLIIELTSEIAEEAAQLSFEHKIPAMDSLIYTTAKMRKAHFITCDNDFRGLPNVTILS